jgi:ion channel
MRPTISATREALGRLFYGRCFYLFITMLVLVAVAPFVEAQHSGLMIRYVISALVMVAAASAVGRTIVSFLVVLLLAAPALALRWLALRTGEASYLDLALRLDAGVYAATIALLLRYVFDREVVTSDRLWGAAAAYLMIGVLWSFLYTIIDRADAQAFVIRGANAPVELLDLLYFSFGTLTTTGFGDILPLSAMARTAAMIEGIVGTLFIAILIARLVGVGVYPAVRQ